MSPSLPPCSPWEQPGVRFPQSRGGRSRVVLAAAKMWSFVLKKFTAEQENKANREVGRERRTG